MLRGRRGNSPQSGAHERNRTADLLLTMQMLYRLSYVGASSGLQAGSTGLWMSSGSEYCRRKANAAKVLAREDATSPCDPRSGSRRERIASPEIQCRPDRGVNAKLVRSLCCVPPAMPTQRSSPELNWSGKRDSNPRPSAWKADALATELFPQSIANTIDGGGGGRIRTSEGV